MRFFKYLVLIFASIISLNAFAAWEVIDNLRLNDKPQLFSPSVFNSPSEACSAYESFARQQYVGVPLNFAQNLIQNNANEYLCSIGSATSTRIIFVNKAVCPVPNYPMVLWFKSAPDVSPTSVPVRRCVNGCTYTGSGRAIETSNGHWSTILTATGDNANCSDANTDTPPPKCDTKDPYGSCYVPPNDNCFRASDGSIYCPDNQQPPLQQGCENGATYCKRPPDGCGSGYVSGSFNGEQLCVKSDPSNPPDPEEPEEPEEPNQCTASYCPKPDQGKDCPDGYYTSTYNGQKICVKDNPTPNQPNPNDPNNTDGGDDGGDAGGGDGSTVSVNLKPVLDAINSLKAALLTALETISRKLSSLVDGQKESNEHLKVIKNEVTKTNEKLDTANGHLEKIEEATTATRDAIGETNDKLDRVFSDDGKEQIEQLGEQSTDSRLTAAESEMTSKLQSFANTLSYSSSHACISDFTVTNIPHFGSMTVPLSKWCDLLALVKLLLKLAVLMLALKMIDATVRAF